MSKKSRRSRAGVLPGEGRLRCHCGSPAVLRSAEGLCRTHRPGAMAYVCSRYPACDSFLNLQIVVVILSFGRRIVHHLIPVQTLLEGLRRLPATLVVIQTQNDFLYTRIVLEIGFQSQRKF